jgi:hypothetical protein
MMLRPEDRGGLSVTWIEHFGQPSLQTLRAAAIAYRASLPSGKLGPTGAFATGNVDAVIQVAASFRKQVRIVHSPEPGNSGHAEVRHFEDDDLELLGRLASDVFTDVTIVASLNLP